MLSSSCDPVIILRSHVFCSSLLGSSVFSSWFIFLWIWSNSTLVSQPVVLIILVWYATSLFCYLEYSFFSPNFHHLRSIPAFCWIALGETSYYRFVVLLCSSNSLGHPTSHRQLRPPEICYINFWYYFHHNFLWGCQQQLFYGDSVNRDFRDYQSRVKRFTCPWDMAKPWRAFFRNFYCYFYSHYNVGICCQCRIGAIYIHTGFHKVFGK